MINKLRPYSCLNVAALQALADLAICAHDVPGAIAECGVANGGSAMWLWHVLGRNRALWLYDSWQGLPPPDPNTDGGRAGTKYEYKMATTGAMCRGEIQTVVKASQVVGCPLDMLHFIPGWFHETMPKEHNRPAKIALLHLDGDWYESVLTPLVWLWPNISPGGAVIFDDYGAWQGAKLAADKFAAEKDIQLEVVGAKARIIKCLD